MYNLEKQLIQSIIIIYTFSFYSPSRKWSDTQIEEIMQLFKTMCQNRSQQNITPCCSTWPICHQPLENRSLNFLQQYQTSTGLTMTSFLLGKSKIAQQNQGILPICFIILKGIAATSTCPHLHTTGCCISCDQIMTTPKLLSLSLKAC